jgi:sulfonate transport system substrate-binding protein
LFRIAQVFPRIAASCDAQPNEPMPRPFLSRRQLIQGGAAAAIAVPALAALGQTPPRTLRVGHQKGYLSLLRGRGTLEKRLAPLGASVKWTEFTAGPVQLEALKVGSIDFGDVGEAPPIFAQAAGAPLAYVAATVPRPASEAVLVPRGSDIRRVADLKGRKIALNKGSNVHYFIVKLFEKHGLPYGDLNLVYLPPADARAAFEKGSIDAWVIWDPFLAPRRASMPACSPTPQVWSATAPTTSRRSTTRAGTGTSRRSSSTN